MSAALKLNPNPNIKLTVQQGPHAGQRFSFSKNKITIGRSPENDIVLVNDPLISRQHAYIEIVENDVEIVNLSQKNPVIINNESVNKWKLVSDTVFLIGGSEFLIQIENQQSIVVMKKSPAPSPVSLVKSRPVIQRPPRAISQKPAMHHTPGFSPIPGPVVSNSSGGVASNSKIKFYVFIGAILAVGLYLGLSDSGSSANKNKKSTIQYSDEIALKINSQESQEALKKTELAMKARQSTSYIRSEENFIKGMRAFQLNNFGSAMEYFQLTLFSQPEHVLAKRYLYLSKVRFDEVLKAKLDLGQSYYQRNNFKLCAAMYQQAIDMLQSKEALPGTPKNTNLQLAETMLKKCEFAAEGIR